ncbi:MAG: outer membrane beta-barrel protein [Bacteroidaceae bacterium]|nr:outer membrane beta-barrel protein [Bacteroidaceae bacterium]
MRKRIQLLALLFLVVSGISAQNNNNKVEKQQRLTGRANISGKTIDYATDEVMSQVAVQLYSLPDSNFVYGVTTDDGGWFSIKKLNVGKYYLRMSFIGYKTQDLNLEIVKDDREKPLGVVKMQDDAIMLGEAVIQDALPPTQVVDDTLMYNVDAFKVPDGSVLEDLVKRLPGVEIDENGAITVNGQPVTRILVDGQEYFGNDQNMAMKNIPVNIIDRIKTYRRKSDFTRITGVEDGEEETVLDLRVKKNMHKGWLSNYDAALGYPVGENDFREWLKALYSGRFTLNRFQANTQFSLNANTNNSGRGGGVNKSTQLGVNFSKNIGEPYPRRRNEFPLVVGGNIRWNGSSSRSLSESESETFTTEYTSSSFRNNRSRSNNESNSVSGDARFEWRPDTSLTIVFRPSFSISRSNSSSRSASVTFNTDPYMATDMEDVLNEYMSLPTELLDSIGVNSQTSANSNDNNSNQISGNFQISKKFNKERNSNGRNLSVDMSFSKNGGESISRSATVQEYYQRHDRDTVMNRYNVNPTDNSSMSGRIMWTEPFDSGRTSLSLSYQIQAQNREQNRQTYVLPVTGDYEYWDEHWYVPSELQQYLNSELSRQATNVTRNHTISMTLRRNTEKVNFQMGLNILPQYTGMDNFKYMGYEIGDTSRVVVNYTPSMSFRYRWTRQKSLRINLNSRTSQPSMEQMMDITDDSNPLNISKGNPGLLPTLNNTMSLEFQNYIEETRQTFNANVSIGNTLRSISNKTDYDPETGVSMTQPMNMEGFWTNWNTSGNFSYQKTFKNTKYRMSSTTNMQYRHQEAYMRTGSIGNYNESAGTGGAAVLSTTRTLSGGERASVTYRDDWLEFSLNGNINFNHSENSVRKDGNMDTYNFSYGGRIDATLPWKNVHLASDINMSSRRGYSGGYNRDDLIWNASASMSFFKGNSGTLRVEYFDILNDESNVNRSVSATGRTDSRNYNINSYFMVHFIYRLNVFGNRQARQEMRQNQGDNRGERQAPPQMQRGGNYGGGRPGGNFGGGRPGGGGGFGGGMPGGGGRM